MVEAIIGKEVNAEIHRDLINEAVGALAEDAGAPGAAGAAGASGAGARP